MVVAQKVKEAEITEQDSLLLLEIPEETENLLRIAIFNISYIRGLFPEKYFSDKSVPALEMKIKKLMPMDAESRRLIDWMEKGVYDALQKKYLKTLLFCVCEALHGPMIEEYAFSFSYSSSDSQEVSMNISRTGTKKGGAFKCNSNAEVTPNQMRSSACKMVRTLVQLMRTLDKMPEERTIIMKLLYYDDVTPADYEPPFFRGCSEEEAQNPWTKSPLKMEVGNVNSKHFVLALKVKSVLDPCEDDNSEDDEVSLGADSVQRDEYSESDSEDIHPSAGQYMVAPVDKGQQDVDGMVDNEDDNDTQDPEEDEQQLNRVKDWINSYHLSSIALTDVLSNFPGITVALTEEIMCKLVEEGILVDKGNDIYTLKNRKVSNFDFPEVKEEKDGLSVGGKGPAISDFMYMKALYHALPMRYVTIAKLQDKFNGEASQNTVRKLIDRMVNEGMVEAKGNRRLGKRIIHSDLTEKRLKEAKKAIENGMDIDATDPPGASHQPHQMKGSTHQDLSTCGVLHSVGSDLTRTRVISDTNKNTSIHSEQIVSRLRENERTPISNAKPADSRESFIPGNRDVDEVENVICSRSTQDKGARKTSMVKEPILQQSKRQKSQAP